MWVDVFRNLPLLLLILFLFLWIPQSARERGRTSCPGWMPEAWQSGLMLAGLSGLVLYNSAVLAEIMRAGILSLPRGQAEAAQALGLSYRQAMRHVILPQGLRRMVPATVSQLITLNKDTTLVSIIAIVEVMRRAPDGDRDVGQPVHGRRRRGADPRGVPVRRAAVHHRQLHALAAVAAAGDPRDEAHGLRAQGRGARAGGAGGLASGRHGGSRADARSLEGGAFFEGPRWRDGRWWVSDFYRGTGLDGRRRTAREEIVLEVPEQPSGLGWMPDGSLLVVSRKDFRVLRRAPDGEVTEHADLSGDWPRATSTTWSSTRRAAPTSATSAST